jgi:predicted ATPase
MGSWRFYQFYDTTGDSNVKTRQFTEHSRYLFRDGGNLAPLLFSLRENHPSSYNNICYAIRQVASFFRDFELEPDGNSILLKWRDINGNEMITAQLSDGTLRFMMLVTLLMHPVLPDSIFLDEPELGLHPYAIDTVASLIKEITYSKKAQITISTQSPLLIDFFEPEDVLVVEHKDAQSIFTRLSSNELSSWLEEFTLGDAWKSNVFGGNPNG